MQRVAQDWLVLELTHNSGTALGITTGLQFLPMLLLSLWGGVIADRYSKRRILMATQSVMGALALILGILSLTGAVRIWQIYALAFGLGLATVKHNVELYGGWVRVESELGKGAAFTLLFPAKTQMKNAPANE